MTYEWRKYPEQEPTESGYYYCVHVMDGQRYYKGIWWNDKRKVWDHWRPHLFREFVSPEVLVFVAESRTDFYCPCEEGVRKNIDKYEPYTG